eukprot:14369789-Ditylum_brightwellii.AAC.1
MARKLGYLPGWSFEVETIGTLVLYLIGTCESESVGMTNLMEENIFKLVAFVVFAGESWSEKRLPGK